MHKKVCIIGFSESTRDQAPIHENSWEFWGMNALHKYVEAPWSRWFEMHTPAYLAANTHRWPEYSEWLRKTELPVVMLDHYEEYPTSVRYPREDVEAMLRERFHTPEQNWSSSTVVYAMLQAALDGAEEIGVYGVDMIKDTEWGHQRPNCNLVIGLLRGAGIKVDIPEGSSLVHSRWLYGYEEPPENQNQLKSRMEGEILALDKTCKEIEMEIVAKKTEFDQHMGALGFGKRWLEHLGDIERGGKS